MSPVINSMSICIIVSIYVNYVSSFSGNNNNCYQKKSVLTAVKSTGFNVNIKAINHFVLFFTLFYTTTIELLLVWLLHNGY